MIRLLVVDDEPDILSTVAQGLPLVCRQELQVRTAQSGEEAKAILETEPAIDVVLCDARMPGMSGLELLRWMRTSGHGARRVLLSAYSPRVFPAGDLEEAGPSAVCTKPLNLRELAQFVATAGAGRGAEVAPHGGH